MASKPSLTVLDVGHGSCAVLTDGVRTTLIDSGPGAAVLEYLLAEGITIIDVVVLSHADEDHIRGLIALLGAEEFEVRRVFLNSDSEKSSEMWRNLAYEIDELRRNGSLTFEVQLREGDVLPDSPTGVDVTVLAPRDRLIMLGPGSRDKFGNRITTNTISAVIRITFAGKSVALITGDLDSVGFAHLNETNPDLTAHVLVFPHHGGLSGGTASAALRFAKDLVAAVQPHSVAVSMGRTRFSNPRPEVIDGMRQGVADVRVACTQLSSRCAATLPSQSPSHLLPLFARGGQDNSCCAGTMRVWLESPDVVLPSEGDHTAFISNAAVTALCRRPLP